MLVVSLDESWIFPFVPQRDRCRMLRGNRYHRLRVTALYTQTIREYMAQ